MMTIATVKALSFPVIVYSERSITTNMKKTDLIYSIESYLNKGGYIGEKIIDSAGQQYEIVSANKISLSWYNIFYPFSDDKIYVVDLKLQPLKKMSFDDVYAEIDALYKRHPRWMSGPQREHTYKLMSQRNTIEGLIRVGFADGRSL